MKLQVKESQRYAKMRAHTATHLLHAEIAQIFPNTKQAGSMVDEDILRFDFVTDRLLNQHEISHIEEKINQIIYLAYDVIVTEIGIDEASKLWAKMFFEDKYGDIVRVVKVDWQDWNISMEFCGGTHVENTKDIWAFTIISQEAIGSGIKRINAITWPKVIEKIQEVQYLLDDAVHKLGIKTATQISDRLDKILKEYEVMKSSFESMESKIITSTLQDIVFDENDDFDKIIKIPKDLNFKNVCFHAKWIFENQNILIYNEEWNFILLSNSASAKDMAGKLWLKWWWNENMLQGRDMKVLNFLK